MLKYDFNNNNAIVDLPSIWKISRDLISITHAGGTDSMNIPSDGLLTVQVGNIDSIISTSSSNSSYIDNTGNNTGNGGGSSSGNNGSSSVSGYNPEDSGIALILDNKSGEDIYITGHTLFCMLTPSGADYDWAPIYFDITPVSSGEAKYLIPKGKSVVIPPSAITVSVEENEPISKYYGGSVFYDGTTPVNWRLYSFTRNSQDLENPDPAVIKTSPGGVNFNEGGYITYVITGTDEANEGTILRSSNPTDLYELYPYVQSSNNSGNEGGNSENGTTPSGNVCYIEQTGGNGIKYVIHNQTGVEARLSGGVVLNLSKNPNDWENATQAYAHMHAPTIGSSYAYNDIIIPVGGTYTSPTVTTITGIYQPNTNFLDGTWYFMNTERSIYMHSIFVYSRIWNNNDNESQGSNHMYWAINPPQNAKLQNGITVHLFLTNINPEATLQDASTGSGQSGHYVILDYQKTGLV